MRKFFLLVFAIALVFAETSVFKKTSIESKKQYGFTETEQYIYDNKKNIDSIQSRLNKIEQSFQDSSDAQGGLRSVIITNSKKISDLEKANQKYEETIALLNQQITYLQETLKRLIAENEALKKDISLRVTNAQMLELSKSLLKEINTNKKSIKELTKVLEIKSPQKAFGNQKPEDILNDAKNYIEKNNFDNARTRLSYLLNDTDFSKARVLYFLGELEYKTQNYKNAIKAFNASGKLDSDAVYMPTLLYHSAISYERLKDKKTAIKYLELLINSYPNNTLKKSATARLKKLQAL